MLGLDVTDPVIIRVRVKTQAYDAINLKCRRAGGRLKVVLCIESIRGTSTD